MIDWKRAEAAIARLESLTERAVAALADHAAALRELAAARRGEDGRTVPADRAGS